MADRAALISLLDADEDELLVRLADEVALGVGPLDPSRKRTIARAWLEAQQERLRAAVCNDPGIRAMRNKETADNLELAAAICDLVASVVGGLPAATVTMLLIRRGLDRLCD